MSSEPNFSRGGDHRGDLIGLANVSAGMAAPMPNSLISRRAVPGSPPHFRSRSASHGALLGEGAAMSRPMPLVEPVTGQLFLQAHVARPRYEFKPEVAALLVRQGEV
jgi:hypothetical protein